ncbi:MAG: hypothetical protein WB810_13880 [Candidatus Cybelea sp.]
MRFRIYGLFVVGALVALVGCSGGTPSAPTFPPGGRQVSSRIDMAAIAETLKARRVVVKQQFCASGAGEATFSAKGPARGHVRGKFVASGVWNFYSGGGQTLWTFSETFKITGRHPADGTITGNGTDAAATCKTFGTVSGKDLTYHLGTLSGAATTNLMKNGSRLLERLH